MSVDDIRQGLTRSDYSVILPCPPEDFTDFISGLLGKAQTLEKIFYSPFEVTRHDIENTFHLVDQRVHQQNEAALVQFTVRIVYDDDSSVLLNCLEDFVSYAEIRPLVSTAAYLYMDILNKVSEQKLCGKAANRAIQ